MKIKNILYNNKTDWLYNLYVPGYYYKISCRNVRHNSSFGDLLPTNELKNRSKFDSSVAFM